MQPTLFPGNASKASLLILWVVGCAVSALLSSPSALAQAPAKDAPPVVEAADALPEFKASTINGTVLSVADLTEALKEQQRAGAGKDTAELRESVRQDITIQLLLAQQAKKSGLEKKPETQTRLRLAEYKILSQAYFVQFMDTHVVKDETLLAEYQRIASQIGSTEYQWSQIVVATQAEAAAAIAKLKQGGQGNEFGTLARQITLDKERSAKNGNMGWSNPAQLLPSIAAVLTRLKPGESSAEAVQTVSGWHILRLDSTRPFVAPKFEEVKANLRLRQVEMDFEKHIQSLKTSAAVK